MPRPTRIEYQHAHYHVMNRGRGRMTIFPNDESYRAFLETLEEAYTRFDTVIHGYCLMRNHYHLLIETPRANLGRIMRHINGIYTQRHNRLQRTDGPLFRGRYKAILVDADAYLLQLTRYIHRNPLDGRGCKPTVLGDYPWSSYPAYLAKVPSPHWLMREKTYQMLGHKHRYAGYRSYVEQSGDEDIERSYGEGKRIYILGDIRFRERARAEAKKGRDPVIAEARLDNALRYRPPVEELVICVAKAYGVSEQAITRRMKAPSPANLPRKVAMYLCQHVGDHSLQVIAKAFHVNHIGSVSRAIHDVKTLLHDNPDQRFTRLYTYFNIKQ